MIARHWDLIAAHDRGCIGCVERVRMCVDRPRTRRVRVIEMCIVCNCATAGLATSGTGARYCPAGLNCINHRRLDRVVAA